MLMTGSASARERPNNAEKPTERYRKKATLDYLWSRDMGDDGVEGVRLEASNFEAGLELECGVACGLSLVVASHVEGGFWPCAAVLAVK